MEDNDPGGHCTLVKNYKSFRDDCSANFGSRIVMKAN